MLYYIDDSVLQAAINQDADVIECLKDFAYAWRKGQCLISASRQTFAGLRIINGLDKYTMVEKSAQGIHNLYASLDFFVVLNTNNARVTSLQQFSNKFVTMDILEFKDPKQINNNFLVCENVRDSSFYVDGTNFLLSSFMGNAFRLNISDGNGGGGTIVDVLKKYEKYPCLAICDTDKKYPNYKIGQTLTDVKAYFNGCHGTRMWMYALEVHEVENLIPLKLLEVVRKEKVHKQRMNTIKSIISTNAGNDFLKYFDFKKGFREKLLVEIKGKDANYFNVCKQMLQNIGKTQHEINKIISMGVNSSKEIISGFGDVILGDTLNYIQCNNINANLLKLNSYQQHDWDAIANKIWSLGCAMVPRRL